MTEIRGDAKNIRSLLGGSKYSIDYYQREYKWENRQVSELIQDLANKFLESYDPKHERAAVQDYGHYFLGSIISSNKDGQKFIIDGQQRLTTLTLLLVRLVHLLDDPEDKGQIVDLIFAKKFGKRTFNLDVPERTACMEALYSNQAFDDTGQPESIRNLLARYDDIVAQLSAELTGKALPYFVDWLIENVHLVEITAYSDADAYTIFETMNDRGLSLTATDMLKGYLLTNITDEARRTSASTAWKGIIGELRELGKGEDADGIKSWLRSQYAETIRERKRGATPEDFDLMGTEFHRWVRDHEKRLGLRSSSDFARFIESNFVFYAYQYARLRRAAHSLTLGLESVYYNAYNNFTLQYPVLLAPLRLDDAEPEILRKIRITSGFLDALIARRIWNFRAIDYSTMMYAMFLIMRDIRGKSAGELAPILSQKLDDEQETFASTDNFHLHGTNRRQIHYILARITDYIEMQSGMPSHFAEYLHRSGRHGYEVEHIWADHPERHSHEFSHPNDFASYRNRIGGLLLLSKSFNASYRDLPYEEKREHYNSQNILARTLHENCYEHNPGFLRFVQESGLRFKPHINFNKADLDERQQLYQNLAQHIWNTQRLHKELSS